MWGAKFWAPRYFAARYWAEVGADPVAGAPHSLCLLGAGI